MAELRSGRLRIGVLISGRGSNLQALIDACARPDYPAEIALVIANRADAFGIERARQAGVTATVIPHRDFADRESFDAALNDGLDTLNRLPHLHAGSAFGSVIAALYHGSRLRVLPLSFEPVLARIHWQDGRPRGPALV